MHCLTVDRCQVFNLFNMRVLVMFSFSFRLAMVLVSDNWWFIMPYRRLFGLFPYLWTVILSWKSSIRTLKWRNIHPLHLTPTCSVKYAYLHIGHCWRSVRFSLEQHRLRRAHKVAECHNPAWSLYSKKELWTRPGLSTAAVKNPERKDNDTKSRLLHKLSCESRRARKAKNDCDTQNASRKSVRLRSSESSSCMDCKDVFWAKAFHCLAAFFDILVK